MRRKTLLTAAGAVVLAAVVVLLLVLSGNSPEDGGEEARCVLSVRCDTVFDNLELLREEKAELIPEDGVLLPETQVPFAPGESAFDVLKRVCRDKGLHFDFATTPGYGSVYIKGIGNLYELDCGERSGWLYHVNGQSPDQGCSEYILADGDTVEFLYSCAWGEDLD